MLGEIQEVTARLASVDENGVADPSHSSVNNNKNSADGLGFKLEKNK